MPTPSPTRPIHLSVRKTADRVLELIEGLGHEAPRVADVGAGHGSFSYLLGERMRKRGLRLEEHLFPCDRLPEYFDYEEVPCRAVGPDGRLPFEDGSFDAVVCIEVIEHVEDQFAFLRELARVARPGGTVIVTTPNVLNMDSRLRNLVWGFPVLFDPLPLDGKDIRTRHGHIHPISPYFLAYGALSAGLTSVRYHGDRTKRWSGTFAILLAPILFAGRRLHLAHLERKHPELAAENRYLLRPLNEWKLLTSRTTILEARKPE